MPPPPFFSFNNPVVETIGECPTRVRISFYTFADTVWAPSEPFYRVRANGKTAQSPVPAAAFGRGRMAETTISCGAHEGPMLVEIDGGSAKDPPPNASLGAGFEVTIDCEPCTEDADPSGDPFISTREPDGSCTTNGVNAPGADIVSSSMVAVSDSVLPDLFGGTPLITETPPDEVAPCDGTVEGVTCADRMGLVGTSSSLIYASMTTAGETLDDGSCQVRAFVLQSNDGDPHGVPARSMSSGGA